MGCTLAVFAFPAQAPSSTLHLTLLFHMPLVLLHGLLQRDHHFFHVLHREPAACILHYKTVHCALRKPLRNLTNIIARPSPLLLMLQPRNGVPIRLLDIPHI